MALTDQAHQAIRDHFSNLTKSLAIDATCGNGHDTEFLARLDFNKVLAFDVQEQAIIATHRRVSESKHTCVQLIQDGHENIANYVDTTVDCVMFNFGYLPNADKSYTTQADTSLRALTSATNLLSPTGLISLLCYPGHSAGEIETAAIQKWFSELESKSKFPWCIETHLSQSPKVTTPVLYILTKISK